MPAQNHIINRQQFIIHTKSEKHAYTIQNSVSSLFHTKIINIIDDICSARVPADQFIRLPALHLNLGTISYAHLEEEFVDAFSRHFAAQLEACLHITKTEEQNFVARPTILHTDEEQGESPALAQSKAEHTWELFYYFLKSGTFPWWAKNKEIIHLEKEFLHILAHPKPDVKDYLAELLTARPTRLRLVQQFSDKLIFEIGRTLSPQSMDIVEQLLALYRDLLQKKKKAYADFRVIFWQLVIFHFTTFRSTQLINRHLVFDSVAAVVDYVHTSEAKVCAALVTDARLAKIVYDHGESRLLSQIKSHLQVKSHRFPQKKDSDEQRSAPAGMDHKKELRDIKRAGEEQFDRQSKTREESKDKRFKKVSISDEPHIDQPARIEKKVDVLDEQQQKSKDLFFQEALFVDNAGLVLLWPYLKIFFTNLGLLSDGLFLTLKQREHAIHLLYFLCTFERSAPENLLTLNKLLCGWDLDKPISKTFRVTKKERLECEKLLQSVISHWSALKNTSVKGFLHSFIQRNGILTHDTDTWLLRVERKAYDILLERLPWSISLLKLSWMKTMLRVEW
ncbi:hypothetical protein EH223_00210 [candidate division KSB1 bacterium]|nr:hypothetical protein [candidate division KSB1 bacterium]RQW07344.1 MAG: hypothetical protein EH223_00210 [candidate division KSB1 bacterium]